MSLVALRAELIRNGLATNYPELQQEAQHILLPFITTGPGTDMARPGDKANESV